MSGPGWFHAQRWMLVVATVLVVAPVAFWVGRSTATQPAARPGSDQPAAPSSGVSRSSTPRSSPTPTGGAEDHTTTSLVGDVSHVVDGDTIDVAGERVRVIGIDTPERGDCGYAESSARMRDLVDGTTVDIIGGPAQSRDRYRRLLGYVMSDAVDIGRVLIEEGLAHARYDSQDGFPWHPREADYRNLDAATPDLCG